MKTFCHEYAYFATGSLSNIQNVYLSVMPHLHNGTFFLLQDFGLTKYTHKSLPKASLMTHLIYQPLCALAIKKTDMLLLTVHTNSLDLGQLKWKRLAVIPNDVHRSTGHTVISV